MHMGRRRNGFTAPLGRVQVASVALYLSSVVCQILCYAVAAYSVLGVVVIVVVTHAVLCVVVIALWVVVSRTDPGIEAIEVSDVGDRGIGIRVPRDGREGRVFSCLGVEVKKTAR
jgi:hypothetical protein